MDELKVPSNDVDVRQLLQSLMTRQAELEAMIAQRELTSAYTIVSGDTAWVMTASALVLFMSMPGLAIYFAGMANSKNVLATVIQIFSITSLITVLWLCFGYSLSLAPTGYHPNTDVVRDNTVLFGDASRFWLQGLKFDSVHALLAPTIPESVFCTFQLSFAIITACLICGSFADRMNFWPMLLFVGLWHLCVYCPIAHATWHPYGFLNKLGVLDFAGGNVVHVSSGISGLIASLILGNRKGWKPKNYDSHPPHNILLTYMGLSMLWMGWYGFNAGSALSAGNLAGNCMLATQISTATASLSWMLVDCALGKAPNVFSFVNGAISGLVSITPACGYVDMTGAFFIGLFGGFFCYFGSRMKHWLFKIDDALDAFGVHAIGGVVGGVCVGFFATATVSQEPDKNGVYYSGNIASGRQLGLQVAGICFSVGWSGVVSYVLLKALDIAIGLRTLEDEDTGLNSSFHHDAEFHADELDINNNKKRGKEKQNVNELGNLSGDLGL